MIIVTKILTVAIQLTCLAVLLIKTPRKGPIFYLSLTLVAVLLIYNIWTLTLMLTGNFDVLNAHRIIGSAVSIANYGLLYMLMRVAHKKAVAALAQDEPSPFL